MKAFTMVFVICTALFMAACGGGDSTNTTSNTAVTTNTTGSTGSTGSTTPSPKPEVKPTDPVGTAAVTGIAACDQYIAKIEKCLNGTKWPEQVRTIYKQNLENYRTAWKMAAQTPQGKQTLPDTCQKALDGAKSAFDMCE